MHLCGPQTELDMDRWLGRNTFPLWRLAVSSLFPHALRRIFLLLFQPVAIVCSRRSNPNRNASAIWFLCADSPDQPHPTETGRQLVPTGRTIAEAEADDFGKGRAHRERVLGQGAVR